MISSIFLFIFCLHAPFVICSNETGPYVDERNWWTVVNYDGTVECNIENVTTFCMFGNYLESDTPFDELIMEMPFFCSSNGSLRHIVNATFEGRDGSIWMRETPEYEPILEIAHNCTSSGKVIYLYQFLLEFSIEEPYLERTYNISIDDEGVPYKGLVKNTVKRQDRKWAEGLTRQFYSKVNTPYVDQNGVLIRD